jgi:hypothetical protein
MVVPVGQVQHHQEELVEVIHLFQVQALQQSHLPVAEVAEVT